MEAMHPPLLPVAPPRSLLSAAYMPVNMDLAPPLRRNAIASSAGLINNLNQAVNGHCPFDVASNDGGKRRNAAMCLIVNSCAIEGNTCID